MIALALSGPPAWAPGCFERVVALRMSSRRLRVRRPGGGVVHAHLAEVSALLLEGMRNEDAGVIFGFERLSHELMLVP